MQWGLIKKLHATFYDVTLQTALDHALSTALFTHLGTKESLSDVLLGLGPAKSNQDQ